MQKITKSLAILLMALGLAACSGCSHMRIEKGDERPFETPLPVNTAPKKLAIGYAVSVGVKEDGTLWSWGTNMYGTLGDGKEGEERFVPAPIPGMTDFVEVAGVTHFLALRKDGTVWSWGDNEYGQLGYDSAPDQFNRRYVHTPQQIPELKNIISIAAAIGHSLALDRDGNVYAFGGNRNQQLGFAPNDNDRHVVPKIVYKNSEAVKLIAYGGAALF